MPMEKTLSILRPLEWLKENKRYIYNDDSSSNIAFRFRHILTLTKKESYDALNLNRLEIRRKYKDLYNDLYILEKEYIIK